MNEMLHRSAHQHLMRNSNREGYVWMPHVSLVPTLSGLLANLFDQIRVSVTPGLDGWASWTRKLREPKSLARSPEVGMRDRVPDEQRIT